MFIHCTTVLVTLMIVIPSGKTLVPRKIEVISFGDGENNNFLEEEYFIPKPRPVNTKQKGKTAAGLECFCLKDSTSIYLPPVKNEDCLCDKKCCKERPANHYLPPGDCEICPKCVCDRKTFTLINKESGNCPSCRPPPEKKCECRSGKYINEDLGNCPIPCNPPPCRCINGRYVNPLSGNCPTKCDPPPCVCRNGHLYHENSGNCPSVCDPPPCVCINGRYVNRGSGNYPAICVPPPCACRNGHLVNIESGNCPPCTPLCSCHKGKLINEGTGICPTSCPYYDVKPEGYEDLPPDFI